MATLQEKYDAGKKAYAASLRKNRGQSGGSSSIPSEGKKSAFRELQRQKFFGDRKDISTDRIDRRTRQEGNLRQFKDSLVRQGNYVKDSKGNPVRDSKGDYVYTNNYTFDTDSSSPTFGQQVGYGVTDKMQDLALRFGPTFREIGSDIGYGLGSMAKGYGIPIVSSVMRGVNAVKSGVEQLWDKVRGEPSEQTATDFPQPGSDTKDLFSSIDTGIAAGDPNNLLVQIAKENANRFANNQTFEERLANATAQNFNLPSISDIVETTGDYIDAAKRGATVDTPIGKFNLSPIDQNLYLSNKVGDNITYGGMINEGGDYNVGINTALPGDFNLSAGTSSNDLGGMSLSQRYLPKIFGTTIPGMGEVVPSLNMSGRGDLNLGVNTTIDPLRMMGINSAIPFDIGIGANINDQGQFTPNVNFNLPFNSNSGLGFMLK